MNSLLNDLIGSFSPILEKYPDTKNKIGKWIKYMILWSNPLKSDKISGKWPKMINNIANPLRLSYLFILTFSLISLISFEFYDIIYLLNII